MILREKCTHSKANCEFDWVNPPQTEFVKLISDGVLVPYFSMSQHLMMIVLCVMSWRQTKQDSRHGINSQLSLNLAGSRKISVKEGGMICISNTL